MAWYCTKPLPLLFTVRPFFIVQSPKSLTNIYFQVLQSTDDKSHWLGKSKEDFAEILKWLSFANSDALGAAGNAFRQLSGVDPYNAASVEKSIEYLKEVSDVFETRLVNHDYLVGDSLTIADIFAASLLIVGFKAFFDPQWRNDYPAFSKWYLAINDIDIVKQVFPPVSVAETGVPNVDPATK